MSASIPIERPAAQLLPTAHNSRIWSLGYDQLVADAFWLVYINYEGDSERRAEDRYARCSEFLDLITSLDPNFVQAYWFTAFSVGAEQKRPDLAAVILQRGINANPNNWYLPYIAGLNKYLFQHDEKSAAKYYRMAAKFPEAPHWVAGQARLLESNVPSLVKEIKTWEVIYRSNEPESVRLRAKEQLIRLWLRVFKTANAKALKDRARVALCDLDFELD